MKPNPRKSTAAGNLRSALIAGVIAFVLYFVITVSIAGYSGNVLWGSLLLGASTVFVTWLIATLISAAVRRRNGS